MSSQPSNEFLGDLIADYRRLPPGLSPGQYVKQWAEQFPEESREELLSELARILTKTYFSRERTIRALQVLFETDLTGGESPESYWRATQLLCLQGRGHSQADLLELVSPNHQITQRPMYHVYLDDFLLSGTRAIGDLGGWLAEIDVWKVSLTIVSLVVCTHGRARVNNLLLQIASHRGIDLQLNWWHIVEVDDHHARFDASDVLRPAESLPDELAAKFTNRYQPRLRKRISHSSRLFSDRGRAVLERELTIAGLNLIEQDGFTKDYVRPLGMQYMPTFGFGLVAATWRHCPNHCPLALWVSGSQWQPLFPRDPARQDFELWCLTPSMFEYPPAQELEEEPISRPLVIDYR